MLDFVEIARAVTVRCAAKHLGFDGRVRVFERADEIRLPRDVGDYEAERTVNRQKLRAVELQGGGVGVPGAALFSDCLLYTSPSPRDS